MEARHAQATATRRSGDLGISAVSETRKLAAILVADVVGYSRLAGADEGIKATLPLGSTAYKTKISAKGERLICWTRASLTGSPPCAAPARATAT